MKAQVRNVCRPALEKNWNRSSSVYKSSVTMNVFGLRILHVIPYIILAAPPTNCDCDLNMNPICKVGTTVYTTMPDLCFRSNSSLRTWKQAKNYCNEIGMYLAAPESHDKGKHIDAIARKKGLETYWIGITYNEETRKIYWVQERIELSPETQFMFFTTGEKLSSNKKCVAAFTNLTFSWPSYHIVACSEIGKVLCQSKARDFPDAPYLKVASHDLRQNFEEGDTLQVVCGASLRKYGSLAFVMKNENKTAIIETHQMEGYQENLTKEQDGTCLRRASGALTFDVTKDLNGTRLGCSTYPNKALGRCFDFDLYCGIFGTIIVGPVKPDRPKIEVLSESTGFAHLVKGTDLIVECAAHLREKDKIAFVLISESKNEVIVDGDERLTYNETGPVLDKLNPECNRHGVAVLTLALTPDMEDKMLICVSNYNESMAAFNESVAGFPCARNKDGCRSFGTIRFSSRFKSFGIPPWMLLIIFGVLFLLLSLAGILTVMLNRGEKINFEAGEGAEETTREATREATQEATKEETGTETGGNDHITETGQSSSGRYAEHSQVATSASAKSESYATTQVSTTGS